MTDTAQRRAIIGGHYYCEEPWYSCPLAENGCANEEIDETVCTCGYDDRVKALDAALQQARREALAEAVKVAREPYSDAVEAYGSDEPSIVGQKIANAIDRLREGRE